jgi:hypothetical protein
VPVVNAVEGRYAEGVSNSSKKGFPGSTIVLCFSVCVHAAKMASRKTPARIFVIGLKKFCGCNIPKNPYRIKRNRPSGTGSMTTLIAFKHFPGNFFASG